MALSNVSTQQSFEVWKTKTNQLIAAFNAIESSSAVIAYDTAGSAYNKANTACTQSDQAGTNANNAYGRGNTAYTHANNAYNFSNTVLVTAQGGFSAANAAAVHATYKMTLRDAWPLSIEALPLAWGEEAYHKLVVTFTYTDWHNSEEKYKSKEFSLVEGSKVTR